MRSHFRPVEFHECKGADPGSVVYILWNVLVSIQASIRLLVCSPHLFPNLSHEVHLDTGHLGLKVSDLQHSIVTVWSKGLRILTATHSGIVSAGKRDIKARVTPTSLPESCTFKPTQTITALTGCPTNCSTVASGIADGSFLLYIQHEVASFSFQT